MLSRARPRQPRLRRLLQRSSAARTSSSSTDIRSPSTTRARRSPRGAQFVEDLLVCDLDLEAADGRPHTRLPRHGPGAARVARAKLPLLDYGDPPRARPERARRARSAARAERAARAPIVPLEARSTRRSMLGLRDYVDKNGFDDVVLGLSGGIDSALIACLAVDALGPERVTRRLDALPLLLGRHAPRRARCSPSRLGVDFREMPDRADHGGLRGGAQPETSPVGSPT